MQLDFTWATGYNNSVIITGYILTNRNPCQPMKVVEQCPRQDNKNLLEKIELAKLEETGNIYAFIF